MSRKCLGSVWKVLWSSGFGARSAGQKDQRHLHARVREAEDGAVRREGGLQRAVGIRLCDNVAAGGAALLRVRDRLINGNQEGMVLH